MIHRLIFENVQPAVDLLTKISSERRCISCYSCELPLVTMQQAISFNILILCLWKKKGCTVIIWCNSKMPLRLFTLLTKSTFYLLDVFNLGRCYNSFHFMFLLRRLKSETKRSACDRNEPLWPKPTNSFYIFMQMHSIKREQMTLIGLLLWTNAKVENPSTQSHTHTLCYDLINIYSYLSLLRSYHCHIFINIWMHLSVFFIISFTCSSERAM